MENGLQAVHIIRDSYNDRIWRNLVQLVLKQRFIAIYSLLILLCGTLIVLSQRFMVVYYGLSLIAVRDSLRIQR